ncbi:DUF4062 domain-containing protein [Clostridium botulinum]|nr:DUF4062 domain-containing protein [Clostridium botulinum]NFP02184.1 DUF4062 domain-containing protein [Clostridium botulinum]
MINKKYQIFISSTYEDLKEERRAVQDTILSMYQFPIGMEMFSAGDEEQWEIIKDTIDSSDYYVLIIAHRYGSKTTEGISYTEKEYQYAKSKGIPILAFIIDNEVLVKPDYMEKDPNSIERLKLLKNDVTNGRVVQWWKSKEELSQLVTNSLYKQFNRKKRPGWVRADNINLEETQNELIQMSKKIRKLEEENEELRKQVVVRKPDIDVKINDENSLSLKFKKYNNVNIIRAEYQQISLEDVVKEYKGKITLEEIDEYNKSLPEEDVLNKYIKDMAKYDAIKNNNLNVEIEIENIENIKANDLRVKLEFPNELLIYKKKEIEKLKTPEAPIKAINPIERLITANLNIDRYSKLIRAFANPLCNDSIRDSFGVASLIGEDRFDYIEDNKLYVNRDGLMHKRQSVIHDKYCIVPLKKGKYNIICRFICEEFEYEIEQVIPVIIK